MSGLALAGLGAWLLAAASSVHGLMLGRAITGLAAGAWVPFVVAFSSLFPPKDTLRAAGYLILLQATGRIIAYAANGPLNIHGGYSLAFYVAVVLPLSPCSLQPSFRSRAVPPLIPP